MNLRRNVRHFCRYALSYHRNGYGWRKAIRNAWEGIR